MDINTEMPAITPEMIKELQAAMLEKMQEVAPPQDRLWWCGKCMKDVRGKFCPNCGAKRTPSLKLKCTRCGQELVIDCEKAPKFCRDCGKKLGAEDIQD